MRGKSRGGARTRRDDDFPLVDKLPLADGHDVELEGPGQGQ